MKFFSYFINLFKPKSKKKVEYSSLLGGLDKLLKEEHELLKRLADNSENQKSNI